MTAEEKCLRLKPIQGLVVIALLQSVTKSELNRRNLPISFGCHFLLTSN